MTRIELTTRIEGKIEDVFDLSRDIGFHCRSASQTGEQAIDGVTEGLIGLNETVTWKGKHFGLWLQHSSKIVVLEYPLRFVDLMIKGHFTYFVHKHEFTEQNNEIIMKDELMYKVPYGIIGRLFDRLVLKNYLTRFLRHRNTMIKQQIEKVYENSTSEIHKQQRAIVI